MYLFLFSLNVSCPVHQAVRAEISGFLQNLRFEVTRKDFNTAVLQCELLLGSTLETQIQVVE